MKNIFFYFIAFNFFIISNLYSIVLVDNDVSIKKNQLYKWSKVYYTVTFQGELYKFKVEGIDEREINDFEILNKTIESTIEHKENQIKILTHSMIYELKPIKTGAVSIPRLIAIYYVVSNDNTLTRNYKELKEVNYYVGGFKSIIIFIIIFIAIFIILSSIFLFIRKQRI